MTIDVKTHTVRLGNKDYVQVSGRVLIAHDGNPEQLSIVTEVVHEDEDKIRVRAAIRTHKGTFTGHAESYKRTGGPQEKKTPLEVAETSAIGRALGFAGYAIEGGIASADEVSNSVSREEAQPKPTRKPEAQPRNGTAPTAPDDFGDPRAELKACIGILRERHWTAERIQDEYLKVIPEGTPSPELTEAEFQKAAKHFDALVRQPVTAGK